MANYDSVNTFELPDNKYLFVDIFCRNNQLICICPIETIKRKIHSLNININGVLLTDYKKVELATKFYAIIYSIYNVDGNTDVRVEVSFNNIKKKYILHHRICKPIYKLIHTTLFKDDFFLLNIFMKYHKKQGVEHFYMYYHRKELLDYEKKDNLTIINWDFPYANHFAQMSQLNHALYKYGIPYSQYILCTDLDEYIYIPKLSLIHFILDKPTFAVYIFLNNWCDTIDVPTDITLYRNQLISKELPDTFYRDRYILPYRERSKLLHNIQLIDNIYYMHTTLETNIYINTENVILHFFRWVPPFSDHGNRTRSDVDFTDYIEFSLDT